MTDYWQERAEAAEDGLFRVVKALGFDTDGAPNADGFFGPMTYCTEDARYTTPADIAVAYATDYRAEVEEEVDDSQRDLNAETAAHADTLNLLETTLKERDRYRAAIDEIRTTLPRPLSEPLSRDFSGRPFPRTIDGDKVADILTRALKETT